MKANLDSQQVRDALANGNIREANRLMGSPYTIQAFVVHGDELGRSLGFPTANLELPADHPFLLRHGVYAVKAETGNIIYKGMANAGMRPTVQGKTMTLEIHLFDFSGDLYGKTLKVSFIDRIRDEKKFGDLRELTRQIREDKKLALSLLS
jgi:riboflavin kinase / FMN adenylyltransferase